MKVTWAPDVLQEEPASVAQSDARLVIRQHSFMEIDHEIFSTVILSLPYGHSFRWFKKGSYQFLEKECAHALVNRLED